MRSVFAEAIAGPGGRGARGRRSANPATGTRELFATAFSRRSIYAKLPSFRPAITRTYASPAAQPHRCCSLSRHRRLPGCLCVQAHRAGQTLLLLFGLLALVAHAFSLYQQLLTPAGLVLDFFNAASLIAAAVILLTLLATLRIPVENLLLLLFPLGASPPCWRYSSPRHRRADQRTTRHPGPHPALDPGLRPAHHRGVPGALAAAQDYRLSTSIRPG